MRPGVSHPASAGWNFGPCDVFQHREPAQEPVPVEEIKRTIYDKTNLPLECYKQINAYIMKRINPDSISNGRDTYCKDNKWELVEGFYCMDCIPMMCRFVHSDEHETNLCIQMDYIQERANE